MKFQGITGNFAEANAEALAIAVFKGEKASSSELKDLDRMTGGLIAEVMKSEEFKGDTGQTALLRFPAKKGRASRLLLVGVGDQNDYSLSSVFALSGTATRYLRKRNVKSFALLARGSFDAAEVAQQAITGFITSQFELDKYKTKDRKTNSVDTLFVAVSGAKGSDLKAGIARG